MGQKTNPTLLRLNKTNQHWNSCWYSDSDYATQFLEDCNINAYIRNCNQQLKKISPILFVKRQRGDLQIALLSTKSAQGIARMGNRYHRLRTASQRARKFPFHSSTKISIPFLPLPQISTRTQHTNSNLSHSRASLKPKTLSLIPIRNSFFTNMRGDARVIKPASCAVDKMSKDLPNLSPTASYPVAYGGREKKQMTENRKGDVDAIVTVAPLCSKFSHAFLSFLFTRHLGLIPATLPARATGSNLNPPGYGVACGGRKKGQITFMPPLIPTIWAPSGTPYAALPYGEMCAPTNSPQKKEKALPSLSATLLPQATPSCGHAVSLATPITPQPTVGPANVRYTIAPTTFFATSRSAVPKNLASAQHRARLETKMPLKNHMECSLYSGTQLKSKIHLLRCPSIHQNPFFLAGQLVFLLQERVTFRRLKHRIIEEVRKDGNIKGVRILCSGRVAARSKKAQKARTDSIQWGATSLNIFSEYVAFASCYAQTIFGKVGVKVWICYERKNITTHPSTPTGIYNH